MPRAGHTSDGSSPRTWGTDPPAPRYRCRGRFIPTHVGNSGGCVRQDPAPAVHPHARGEQQCAITSTGLVFGSSPRTWGTVVLGDCPRLAHRFIPTHVGNRRVVGSPCSVITVHPHARGEQLGDHGHALWHGGSSPRTWGTEQRAKSSVRAARFIPTHVGNSILSDFVPDDIAVHPHARGEQFIRACAISLSVGSSPRTWGTVPLDQLRRLGRRFIPTHVGNRQ